MPREHTLFFLGTKSQARVRRRSKVLAPVSVDLLEPQPGADAVLAVAQLVDGGDGGGEDDACREDLH